MPRYFFHVFGLDEEGLLDDEGEDHPSELMAVEMAREIAEDLASDPELDAYRIRIQVIDEQGALIVDAAVGELSALYP